MRSFGLGLCGQTAMTEGMQHELRKGRLLMCCQGALQTLLD